MDAVQSVQAAESACHRVLRDSRDDVSRALLLEALASFKAVPLTSFPATVLDLVKASRDHADKLSNGILESRTLSDPMIDHEIREVCHSLGCLAAGLTNALRPSAQGVKAAPRPE